MITNTELHTNLMYNPWDGLFYWKVSNSNKVTISSIAGTTNKKGYVYITINNNKFLAHRLAWFYVFKQWPKKLIDHIDQIKHHNWISNLRDSTMQRQQRNQGNQNNNTSGVKGVSFITRDQKYQAKIKLNGKHISLGYYTNFDDAVCARLAGEQCLDWEKCEQNSPANLYVKENIQNDYYRNARL